MDNLRPAAGDVKRELFKRGEGVKGGVKIPLNPPFSKGDISKGVYWLRCGWGGGKRRRGA